MSIVLAREVGEREGFEEACGCVDVKRVASFGVRGIVDYVGGFWRA